MAKQLVFAEEARRRLQHGMDILANAVVTTLGPKGRNVALDRKFGSPTITHDGVTVAKEVELEDPFENMGAQLLEEAASAGEVVVLVVDASFRDREVTVPVGTTVMWVYNGSLPHTVTSDSGLFDSGALGDGGSFSHTFDEPGTFPYHCRFHGGPGGSAMSGVIIVEEG